MKRNQILFSFFIILWSFSSLGQGWERTFGGESIELGHGILQTPNGDFIGCGYTTSFENDLEALYIFRTDIDGHTVWENTYGEDDAREYGQSIIATSDGNYLIAGYTTIEAESEDVYLLKINPAGEAIWSSIIAGPGRDFGYQVIETIDGGFAVIGFTIDQLSNQRDIYLAKTDANGSPLWNRRIGGELLDVAYAVIQLPNEDYVISGYQTTVLPNDTIREAVLLQTDALGIVEETFSLGETTLVSDSDIIAEEDGYVVAVYNDFSVHLKKVNTSGDILWSREMPSFTTVPGSSLTHTPNGGYAIVGGYRPDGQNEDDLYLIITDADGETILTKTFGNPINDDVGLGICNTMNQGYGIIGYTRSFGAGLFDMYALMTDSLGNTLNNFVRGNVYYDLDEECDPDAGEFGLNDWLIEVVGDDETYYGLSDETGNYHIAVEPGDYTLNLILLNDYWQSCGNGFNISLSGSYDTTTVDFPVQALYDCPLLEVDISTPFLRRCYDNVYTVSYCNDGTTDAIDAEIEIELDEYLIVDGASINWSSNTGNTFVFDVPSIPVNTCGEFFIYATVDCDSTLLGQTHCVEAHITPDSICSPVQNCWDGGSVELDASCNGDSVVFTVKNVGNNVISEALNYIVIEDHVILFNGNTNDDIPPNESRAISWPADGSTVRLEIDQVACHPGNSTPTATVEGCGLVDNSSISLGYLTQYYEDDGNPFFSIDCQENIGSWDPNDKRGFPKGYENQHYIEANTDLEYHIRFQNTGTDTAFRVVIRDTLSEWLDIRNIQTGAASYPYDFELYGNVMKFTFTDINLPDSTTNEVASHGFIKFRIAQQLDNPVGTEIMNSAAIFFDFNEPVITNETVHRIGEQYIEIVSNKEIYFPGVQVNFYPNPFEQETNFEITYDDGAIIPSSERKTFRLYDGQGRFVRSESFEGNQFKFQRRSLPTGLYFFQIETKNNLIFGGKLIAH